MALASSVVQLALLSAALLFFVFQLYLPYDEELRVQFRERKKAQANVDVVCSNRVLLAAHDGHDRCAADRERLEMNPRTEAINAVLRRQGICPAGGCVTVNIFTFITLVVPLCVVTALALFVYVVWQLWERMNSRGALPFAHASYGPSVHFGKPAQTYPPPSESPFSVVTHRVGRK